MTATSKTQPIIATAPGSQERGKQSTSYSSNTKTSTEQPEYPKVTQNLDLGSHGNEKPTGGTNYQNIVSVD
jgi:hypothetical protein